MKAGHELLAVWQETFTFSVPLSGGKPEKKPGHSKKRMPN